MLTSILLYVGVAYHVRCLQQLLPDQVAVKIDKKLCGQAFNEAAKHMLAQKVGPTSSGQLVSSLPC
jgi:hypothetical protein